MGRDPFYDYVPGVLEAVGVSDGGKGVSVSVGVRMTGGTGVSVGKAVGGIVVGVNVGEAVGVGKARLNVTRLSA